MLRYGVEKLDRIDSMNVEIYLQSPSHSYPHPPPPPLQQAHWIDVTNLRATKEIYVIGQSLTHTVPQLPNEFRSNLIFKWFKQIFQRRGLPWPSIPKAYVYVVLYLTWWVIHLSDTLIMIGLFKWMKLYFVMSFAHQSTIKLQRKEQLHE